MSRAIVMSGASYALIALLASRCGETPKPATVHTANVERRDLRRTVTVRGQLTPNRYVEIRAPAGSVVNDVLATVGERVDEGQPLLKIASPAIAASPSAALPLLERQTASARRRIVVSKGSSRKAPKSRTLSACRCPGSSNCFW